MKSTIPSFLRMLFFMSLCFDCVAFAPASVVRPSRTTVVVAAMKDPRDSDDIPREEMDDEYTGSVDWDAEWKKVMEKEKRGEPIERPGKDFYKSDAELAAIRAANKAQQQVQKMSTKMPSVPNMNVRSLSGDWRVCILL